MVRHSNLDVLRLFLASEVLYVHLWALTHRGTSPWLPLSPVAAFVAISGYCILGSLERSKGFGEFWEKRARRIVPAFVASLALVALLFGLPTMGRAVMTWATFGATLGGMNAPLWSLSCEEVLYGSLCLLSLTGFTKSRKAILAGIALALAVRVAVGGIPDAGRYTGLAPSFLIGVYLYRFGVPKVSGWWFLAIAAGSQAIGFHYPNVITGFASIVCGAIGVVTLGVAQPLPVRVKHDWSYGLYITHFPLLQWLTWQGLTGWLFWLVGAGVSYAVAGLSSRFIERPFIHTNRRTRPTDATPMYGQEPAACIAPASS